MAFYHIKITTSQKKYIFQLDLGKEKVIEFLKKYLDHQSFFIDGYSLHFDKIDQFKVAMTNLSSSQVVQDVKRDYYVAGIVAAVNRFDIIDDLDYAKDVTNDLMNEINERPSSLNKSKYSVSSKKVFVVHGHNVNMLTKVENFLRKLKLEPIILNKEADKGKTVIEKIEEYSGQVCYSIVLYSGCDIGYKVGDEKNAMPRARQNVIFEHGYMMALLGRPNLCALLESDKIEKPSDINGLLYVPFDDNDSWEIKIAKNMRAAGVEVDLNKL